MSSQESFRPSPLGRYESRFDPDATLFDIRLLGVPVALFFVTRQQHDELVREFAVMGLGAADGSLLPEHQELVQELGVHYARAATPTDLEVEAAARAGETVVDLRYEAQASVLVGADRLESLLTRADDFCRQGRMLAMPRPPEVQLFSAWWLGGASASNRWRAAPAVARLRCVTQPLTDGFWRRAPSPQAVEIFGELTTLGGLVQLAVDAGWRPLHVAETTLDEFDTWESDWRAGLELSGHPQALAPADERRSEYFEAYRGVLGFAWMVLFRPATSL